MGLIWTHVLRRLGARQVIATDLLGWRLDWAKRFGASAVVDASKEDSVEAVKELTGGEMKTGKGKADAPKLTITQSVEDWREINSGRLNPQMAFMSGKIKVSGDMSLAMKLGSIMGS